MTHRVRLTKLSLFKILPYASSTHLPTHKRELPMGLGPRSLKRLEEEGAPSIKGAGRAEVTGGHPQCYALYPPLKGNIVVIAEITD